MTPPVFRFAPSPNGYLHLGHAASALWNEREAAKIGGRLLLRIEDIDLARSRPEFIAAIEEDLGWLGLRFDGEVRRQSRHFGDYSAALARLDAMGLIYPCFCARSDITRAAQERGLFAKDPDGAPLYPRMCEGLPASIAGERMARGGQPALRLDMAKAMARVARPLDYARFDAGGCETLVEARPQRWGDVILARKDVPTSYHLAVTVDDALQGVTHVVRGQDLEAATDVHVLLQRLLGLPTPRYLFHPLILDRMDASSPRAVAPKRLRDLIRAGASPGTIRAQLGFGPLRL